MSDEQEQCGELKGSGEPCDYGAKYADGKCGIHSDVPDTSQGQPTKFSDERAQAAVAAARFGKSKRGCERAAGVAKGTLDNWLDQGYTFTDESGQIASFFTAFAQARARGESQCIENARREDGDPSFERFMLASSYGYKKTEQREVTGEDGGPVSIEFNEQIVETPWGEETESE